MLGLIKKLPLNRSPSSRRAWIEIGCWCTRKQNHIVALLAEGVDRNSNVVIRVKIIVTVALLAEGVDRNRDTETRIQKEQVALLAEGVDRNSTQQPQRYLLKRSPSSRRAWIEIPKKNRRKPK